MRERVVSSIIVALAGLFYIFAPHELHISAQVDFSLSHGVHIMLGIVLLGIAVYYARIKPLPEKKEAKKTGKRVRRKARRRKRSVSGRKRRRKTARRRR